MACPWCHVTYTWYDRAVDRWERFAQLDHLLTYRSGAWKLRRAWHRRFHGESRNT